MRNLILLLCLAAFAFSPAMAGKNAGGGMVVHTDDAINWTFFDPPPYCEVFPYTGEDCVDLNPTSTFVDPNFLLGALTYYVAVFPPGSSPGVTVIYFGHDHNFAPGFIAGWSLCGPANSLEIPDAGWPHDVNAGNSLAFGSPVVGDRLFPFYWVSAYGDVGNYIGPGINPTGGYAAFVSDDYPGVLDDCFLFGQLRWAPEQGHNDCAIAEPEGACCYLDGTCLYLFSSECFDSGGNTWTPVEPCDPNPCPQPGACCFDDGSCQVMLEEFCDAYFFLPDTPCEPNPCVPRYGACCLDDGSCLELPEEDCSFVSDLWIPDEACDPNPCPPPALLGACCFEDGSCQSPIEEGPCFDMGGYLWVENEDCADDPCPPVATETATWGQIKANYK